MPAWMLPSSRIDDNGLNLYKLESIGRVEGGQAAPSFKQGFYKFQQTVLALNQMLLTAGTMARPGFAGAGEFLDVGQTLLT